MLQTLLGQKKYEEEMSEEQALSEKNAIVNKPRDATKNVNRSENYHRKPLMTIANLIMMTLHWKNQTMVKREQK